MYYWNFRQNDECQYVFKCRRCYKTFRHSKHSNSLFWYSSTQCVLLFWYFPILKYKFSYDEHDIFFAKILYDETHYARTSNFEFYLLFPIVSSSGFFCDLALLLVHIHVYCTFSSKHLKVPNSYWCSTWLWLSSRKLQYGQQMPVLFCL